jgi:hypothetical protein
MNGKECAVVHLYFHLAEIACGDFSGHYFVARRQKAWFLPAAHAGLYAALFPSLLEKWPAAIFRTLASLPPAKSVVFAGCATWATQGRQAAAQIAVLNSPVLV